MTFAPTHRFVVVAAPNGLAALALQRRLAHLTPVAVTRGGQWVLEIPDVEPDEIEAGIRLWLVEMELSRTLVQADGRVSHVEIEAPRRRHVPTNAHFIG